MIGNIIIGLIVWTAIFCVGWRIGCLTSYYEGQKVRKDYIDFLKGPDQKETLP